MKKFAIVILLALTLSVSVTAQNAQPYIDEDSIDFSPSNPEVGEDVTISAVARDTGKILAISSDYPGSNGWDAEACDSSLRCPGEWTFTAEEAGTYDIRFRALDSNNQYSETVTESIQIGSGEEDSNLEVDLESPSGDITDTSPNYEWEVSDDVYDEMEEVELVVDDDSNPFSNPLHEETFDDSDSEAEANDQISFNPPSSWDLETGEDYTWGIRAENEDGDNVEETEDFSIVEETEQGNLEVTVTDNENDELEDATVTIENGDSEEESTDNNGEASFEDLEAGTEYEVTAECESESETEDIEIEEGDNDLEIELDFESSDNECDTDENEDPTARFDYYPNNPEAGEEVEFDAGDSSDDGSIESYEWDFDDGEEASGEVVEHTFDSEGEYDVELTVEDNDGRSDTTDRPVSVGQNPNACGINENSFDFTLNDYTIDRGEETEAELEIFNTGTEDQEVEVEIKVDNEIVRERTLTVQAQDSRTVTADISPETNQFVSADISTSEPPCGSQVFDDLEQLTREITVLGASEEQTSLDVDVTDEDGEPVEGARVEAVGPEDTTRFTDSRGSTGFELEPGDYEIIVSHPRYLTESEDVELQSGDDEELYFELQERDDYSDEDGTLEVTVLDEDGHWIEDAKVEVENGDDRTRYTDNYGFVDFRLEEGSYDIEVSHPDYDDREFGTAYIESGETDSRTFRLGRYEDYQDDGIEITSVDYPDSVCRGSTFTVDYTVRNNEHYDESAQTTASGLGGNIITNTYVIESGDSVSGTLRFTNAQGSGRESFRIRVQNGTSDEITRTVRVNDCTGQQPSPDQDATGISMKLSYPIAPNRALVGDTIKVSGFVDGVTGRTSVNIDVDGDRAARVSTQPDGYYQTYIRAESVGTKTVRARAGGNSASRTLEVLPTANVGLLDAPQRVFEGQNYEICTTVNSQVEAKVILLRDGRLIEETNANGEVCFERQATQPGSHVYEVRALTTTETSTSSTSVRVLETDVEASSFPDQVASIESGDGMVKVDLYNTHDELKRYNLELRGLPSTWLSQSSREVILDSGERETVYFYLTPRDEGVYDPEIVVTADNQDIYREQVDLEVGGQEEPRRRSLVERFRSFFSL